MKGVIYCASCTMNGKKYIGQTVATLAKRKRQHKHDSKTVDTKFYRAVRKHGWNSFTWEILESGITEISELNRLEQFYIEQLDTYATGYNSTIGGEGSPGSIPDEQTRHKMSLAHIGKTGSLCHNSKTVIQIDKLSEKVIAEYGSANEAERITGVSFSNICKVCRGKRKQAGGFKWQYK